MGPLVLCLLLQDPWGWSLRVEHSGERSAELVVPAAAFVLDDGDALHPAIPPAGFRALYSAALQVEGAGRYRFALEAQGGSARLTVEAPGGALSVEGAEPSPWVELERGALPLQVVFARSEAAKARLRVLWERETTPRGGFPLEPLPSRAVRPAEGVHGALLTRRGRVLLEEKGCTNCHAPSDAERAAVGLRPGPTLTGIGARVSRAWLARWIAAPHELRPGADMPALFFGDPDAPAGVSALIDFLATLDAPPDGNGGNGGDGGDGGDGVGGEGAQDALPTGAPTDADVARGRTLYHTIGCAACHGALAAPAEVFGAPELFSSALPSGEPVAPLGDLAGKWRAPALARFLVDPRAVHPDGRMPRMELDTEEARDLAAYLSAHFGPAGEDEPPIAPDPERGLALFAERGCAACHALPGFAPAPAPPLAALSPERGCLDPADRRTPRYALTLAEHEALVAGLAEARATTGAPAPLDEVARTLDGLRCTACHALDGAGGPPAELRAYFTSTDDRVDLGDEGRFPPDLSGVGFKLTTAWLREVLHEGGHARPYLTARMPQYGEAALGELEAGLARRVGVIPNTDAVEPRATDEAVRTGRTLMAHENLGCMTCHVYADYPPSGTPGLSITAFGERLRYEWYRAFMQNPQRFTPGSRMPDFGTGGRSSLLTVLDGDLARQADAMWCYFGLGELMPPPEGVEPRGGLPVRVDERPVVLRAFLEDAGSRAIAVGLPVGVHFAFDAQAVRLVDAWQGEFVDASGAWAGRGGTALEGRGEILWRAPAGVALAILPLDAASPPPFGAPWPEAVGAEAGQRFRGYELDAGGHPSFLYEIDGVAVAERPDARALPVPEIERAFTLRGLGAERIVLLRASAGALDLEGVEGCRALERRDREEDVVFVLVTEGTDPVTFRLRVRP